MSQFTSSELKVLFAHYKHDFVYSHKKHYGVSTNEELEKIVKHLEGIAALVPGSYSSTKDGSIKFGNNLIVSDCGKAILKENNMI